MTFQSRFWVGAETKTQLTWSWVEQTGWVSEYYKISKCVCVRWVREPENKRYYWSRAAARSLSLLRFRFSSSWRSSSWTASMSSFFAIRALEKKKVRVRFQIKKLKQAQPKERAHVWPISLFSLKNSRISFHVFIIAEDILWGILLTILAKHFPYSRWNVRVDMAPFGRRRLWETRGTMTFRPTMCGWWGSWRSCVRLADFGNRGFRSGWGRWEDLLACTTWMSRCRMWLLASSNNCCRRRFWRWRLLQGCRWRPFTRTYLEIIMIRRYRSSEEPEGSSPDVVAEAACARFNLAFSFFVRVKYPSKLRASSPSRTWPDLFFLES